MNLLFYDQISNACSKSPCVPYQVNVTGRCMLENVWSEIKLTRLRTYDT